jgi:hypothetical protein
LPICNRSAESGFSHWIALVDFCGQHRLARVAGCHDCGGLCGVGVDAIPADPPRKRRARVLPVLEGRFPGGILVHDFLARWRRASSRLIPYPWRQIGFLRPEYGARTRPGITQRVIVNRRSFIALEARLLSPPDASLIVIAYSVCIASPATPKMAAGRRKRPRNHAGFVLASVGYPCAAWSIRSSRTSAGTSRVQ